MFTEPTAAELRIDSMRLRVPGLGREEAARLGHDVAEILAARMQGGGPLAALPSRRVGALQLRLEPRAGASRRELAEHIVDRIVEALT